MNGFPRKRYIYRSPLSDHICASVYENNQHSRLWPRLSPKYYSPDCSNCTKRRRVENRQLRENHRSLLPESKRLSVSIPSRISDIPCEHQEAFPTHGLLWSFFIEECLCDVEMDFGGCCYGLSSLLQRQPVAIALWTGLLLLTVNMFRAC